MLLSEALSWTFNVDITVLKSKSRVFMKHPGEII